MQPSIKALPKTTDVLKSSGLSALPGDTSCKSQLAHIHKLRDSEEGFQKHQFDLCMNVMRTREGLAAPLKIGMELFAARQIGRLPFLQSSNMMEDVLLGRDEHIGFSDFLNVPETNEILRQPHAVVEKTFKF